MATALEYCDTEGGGAWTNNADAWDGDTSSWDYASTATAATTTWGNVGSTRTNFAAIPSGATVQGILVEVYAYGDADDYIDVELYQAGATAYTAAKSVTPGTGAGWKTLGGAADTWGVTWSVDNDIDVATMGCRITKRTSTKAGTMYVGSVRMTVTYTSVTAISVTDTLGLADSVVRGRAFTITDTSSLSDGVLRNKSLIEADTLTLSDSKSVNKTMSITDLLGLADAVFRGKAFTLTDTIGLADAAIKAVQLLITDSISLADSVLRDKALVISESIGLAEAGLRDKALTETDALSLLDQILLAAEKLLTDDISLEDLVEVEKTVPVVEAVAGGGSSRPFRWTYIPTRKTPEELKGRRKYRQRMIVVEDFLHLTDAVRKDILSFAVPETVHLDDLVRVEKRITITDAVLLQDTVQKHRYLAVQDYISLVEGLSLFAKIPDYPSIVVRERSLEVAETIRLLARGARGSLLRRRLIRASDPSLTKKVEAGYVSELDRLFVAFKRDAAKILGRRELSDDWDEVDAPDLMEKFDRVIEVTITIPGQGVVKKFTTRAYTAGGLRSSQFLSSLGVKAVFSILPADRAALDILVTRDLSGLKGITDEMSKQIMAEITDGMLRGDSMDKVAKAIDDRIDNIGRTRAEMLARTETMKAFNEGALTQYDKHGITEVEWLAAPGERTCDECLSLDGQRFPIDGRPDCPVHPNCRCVLLPIVPEI